MAFQIEGFGGTVAEVDGTNFRALRVVSKPIDYGALGAYGINLVTGVMAAGVAANSEIFQARWVDSTRLCCIFRIGNEGAGSIVAFAAGATKFEAMIARSWTADGTSGNPSTLTGNNQKLRTSMGSSLFVGTGVRMASTGALGAGTKTLDAHGIGATNSSVTATAGAVVLPPDTLFQANNMDNHPIVLVQNEGPIVRATVPATGTWTAGISMRWAEVVSY